MKKIVILTGAGISAESGLSTYRNDDGSIWNNYDVKEVATKDAWKKDPVKVIYFHNELRKLVLNAKPNKAHKTLVDLEEKFIVQIITQNIDDLHERAGSSFVLHIHGEILKARSILDPSITIDIKKDMDINDRCSSGSRLRPDVVWFGEEVTKFELATEIVNDADIFCVIGTSLKVYPASDLIKFVKDHVPIFVVDPNDQHIKTLISPRITYIKEKATEGVPKLVSDLLSEFVDK